MTQTEHEKKERDIKAGSITTSCSPIDAFVIGWNMASRYSDVKDKISNESPPKKT